MCEWRAVIASPIENKSLNTNQSKLPRSPGIQGQTKHSHLLFSDKFKQKFPSNSETESN